MVAMGKLILSLECYKVWRDGVPWIVSLPGKQSSYTYLERKDLPLAELNPLDVLPVEEAEDLAEDFPDL